MKEQQVIALAGGTGDLGRYLCEELSNDDRYTVALLTRQADLRLDNPKVTIHTTDYSEASVLSILNATGATALISAIRCPDDEFVSMHEGFINACKKSSTCKRFIPSEWAGNIEEYPDCPGTYARTRGPVRKILQDTSDIQWTLFNLGWFMEYFLPEEYSYMRAIPGEFPINHKTWRYCVRGTGDEPQAWTCGRDVARAVAELLAADDWEPVTYVAGGWGTFNEAAKLLERFHDRPLERDYRSLDDINQSFEMYQHKYGSDELNIVEIEQWTVSGATACPEEKTRKQYENYFSNMHFLSLEEMLLKAKNEGHV